MGYFVVDGGVPLEGQVEISGAKNAALPILFATLLLEGTTTLYRVPDIGDTRLALEILRGMGAEVHHLDAHTLSIKTDSCSPDAIPLHLTGEMRASAYLLGACLARFGRCPIPTTGGCDFGDRPLDRHYGVFQAMGAKTSGELFAEGSLRAIRHRFSEVSVGATINAVFAAIAADGVTRLENCAREGHVTDLLRFLRQSGACIRGIGSSELIISGGTPLKGSRYTILPDEIEAGTYLSAVAATGGRVTTLGVSPHALRPLTNALIQMGCEVQEGVFSVTCKREGPLKGVRVVTGPHPAFPTDLHPPLVAVMLQAEEPSSLCETVWRDRYQYTRELSKLGAHLKIEGDTLHVYPTPLTAGDMIATDLRGGAACLISALACKGYARIEKGERLLRGYESLGVKLTSLGGRVRYFP